MITFMFTVLCCKSENKKIKIDFFKNSLSQETVQNKSIKCNHYFIILNLSFIDLAPIRQLYLKHIFFYKKMKILFFFLKNS